MVDWVKSTLWPPFSISIEQYESARPVLCDGRSVSYRDLVGVSLGLLGLEGYKGERVSHWLLDNIEFL